MPTKQDLGSFLGVAFKNSYEHPRHFCFEESPPRLEFHDYFTSVTPYHRYDHAIRNITVGKCTMVEIPRVVTRLQRGEVTLLHPLSQTLEFHNRIISSLCPSECRVFNPKQVSWKTGYGLDTFIRPTGSVGPNMDEFYMLSVTRLSLRRTFSLSA